MFNLVDEGVFPMDLFYQFKLASGLTHYVL